MHPKMFAESGILFIFINKVVFMFNFCIEYIKFSILAMLYRMSARSY